MSSSDYIHLEDCSVLQVTDNAILISYDDDTHWIPKSQIADADVYEKGDSNITISITEWIANQKGIQGES